MAQVLKFDPQALSVATMDAYSASSFAPGQWLEACRSLGSMGLTWAEAETILRSKATRFCRDMFTDDGWGTALSLMQFLQSDLHFFAEMLRETHREAAQEAGAKLVQAIG